MSKELRKDEVVNFFYYFLYLFNNRLLVNPTHLQYHMLNKATLVKLKDFHIRTMML